jgi:Flp pilus assembly protein TadD
LIAQQEHRYEESLPLLEQALALNPDDPDTLNNLADSHLGLDQNQPAVCYLRRRVELLPQSAEAHHRLGCVQERMGDLEDAAQSYRRALALEPDSPDRYSSLAKVQYRLGAYAEAAECCRRALALDPNRHDIYSLLGSVLTELGKDGAAVEALRRALALQPDSADAIFGLGYFFEKKGDLASAAEAFRKAFQLDPRMEGALLHLGIIHILQADLEAAAEYFQRALQMRQDFAEARSFLGLIHLAQGNYRLGWREYEDRRGTDQFLRARRKFSQPFWKGEPLEGTSILLYAEQGLGDTLHFVRCVPLVAARGGKVILEVPQRLHRLLAHTPGAQAVIRQGETLPEFDWQCPLLSLPVAFGTELSTIPAPIPYLAPDPAQAAAWRERLHGNSLGVGLAWGGSSAHPYDAQRSIPLEQLAPLTRLEGTTFYSLQMGPPAEQIKQLGTRARVIDLQSEQQDFADTAAIVANLDLVISIDTSVVHLAGAMGKPVWVLLYKSPDWRWMLGREDSPWYPTARLFRQSTLGNWQDVVARVERELRELATRTAASWTEGHCQEGSH